MAKPIESGWEDYRRNVIPADAPQVQVEETRNGFYAGAWCLFSAVMNGLEPGTEPTVGDLIMLDEMAAELRAFARSKKG